MVASIYLRFCFEVGVSRYIFTNSNSDSKALLLTGNMSVHFIKNTLVVQMQGDLRSSYYLQIIYDPCISFYL